MTPEHNSLCKTTSKCHPTSGSQLPIVTHHFQARKKLSSLKRTELTLCLYLSLLRVRHYVDWFNGDCICLLKVKLCCSYRNLLASICLCWTLQAPSPLSQDQVLSASLSLSGRSCAAAWMPPRQEAMTGGCWPINSTWTGECVQASGPVAFISNGLQYWKQLDRKQHSVSFSPHYISVYIFILKVCIKFLYTLNHVLPNSSKRSSRLCNIYHNLFV